MLEVENVTVGPLRDLSLSVGAGEIVGVAGLLALADRPCSTWCSAPAAPTPAAW